MTKGKPVMINLLATARHDQTPDYPIQLITKGRLFMPKHGEALLEYTETQQDEETGEMTTAEVSLALEKKRVTMTRRGDFANTMVFVPDQRFEGVYRTPYGEMNMAVFSRGVWCNVGEERGSVHLKYQLDIQGAYASTNELHLEYVSENGGEEP